MTGPPDVATGAASAPSASPAPRTSVGRHAVIYAIGNILGKAVAFLMLPIYTRYLSPSDYGIVALIDMTLDVIAIMAGAQIAQGIYRFYHKADGEDERRLVVSTALVALGISFAALGVVTYAAAGPMSRLVFGTDAHADLVRLASGSLALQSMLIVPLTFGRVEERSTLVVGVNVVRLLLSLGLNVTFVVAMRLGVKGVFLSTLITNVVLGVGLSVWTARHVGVRLSLRVLRTLIRYGGPLMAVQAATFTMTFADRYFLQAAGNEAVVGLYNLAYQFGFLLLFLGFVPVDMIWGPRRFLVARSADPQPTLARAFRLINVSVFTVGMVIALFVGDVLRIMAAPPFHAAARVVPIILIAYVFHGWAMIQDLGVLVKERTEFLTIANWTAALVAVASFAILIPRYLATGAALAAVLAFGVRWGLTYWFSQRLWRIRYDWAPILRLAGVAGGLCLISVLTPQFRLVPSLAYHALLLGLYLILIWTGAILRPDEKEMARAYLRRAGRALGARRGAA